MQNFNPSNTLKAEWELSNQTVIDYHHQSTQSTVSSAFPSSYGTTSSYPPFSYNSLHSYGIQPSKVPPPSTNNLDAEFQHRIQPLSTNLPPQEYQPQIVEESRNANQFRMQPLNTNKPPQLYQHPSLEESRAVNQQRLQPFNTNKPPQVYQPPILEESRTVNQIDHMAKSYRATIAKDVCFVSKKYDPFVEDKLDDMDISDDEKPSQKIAISTLQRQKKSHSSHESVKVNSGAAFYKGLILYIPPFEQIANSYRGSPAIKMLYASFEFSFKMPIKIETKARENSPNMTDATIYFQDHILSTGSGFAPHIEASVRALEILSETCYTIQAKEDYFLKCKLVDAETMKTLNLKKWEAVCQKYPKLTEITKESHFQKTFALFLDSHTSTEIFDDIVCCNLTRQDVNNIKSVVEFFNLTMLPCSVSTNLSKKHTPCVVSIHMYTSAQKLLDILVENGGENDKFKLHPPDTFKDFYKLHQSFWDPAKNKNDKNNQNDLRSTLNDNDLQVLILKPYENTISDLFEKYKTLPKVKRLGENCLLRKTGDDFMKETLHIDMANSKNVAPVERMQLLLKYMEQLQEYGSRVLKSGRPEMIKIYHNAIDNLRKDLDTCRKDIEDDQKGKILSNVVVQPEKPAVSQTLRKRTPPKRRSKSPNRKNRRASKRSISPRRNDRPQRSPSPKRRPRSKSPRKRAPFRASSPRKTRSPYRKYSPLPMQDQPPNYSQSNEKNVFADRLKKYTENLRRFRIEIEDTPRETRSTLKDKFATLKEQLHKLYKEASANPRELENYIDELEICKDEIREQTEMLVDKSSFSRLSYSSSPPPWMNVRSFEPVNTPVSYPLPGPRSDYGSRTTTTAGLKGQDTHMGYNFPY